DFLQQDGMLALGAKTFSVGLDYTNANWGTGNTFNPRANVTGAGGILAVGGTGQTLAGDLTGGSSATPVMSFGNVHVGDSRVRNYRINNTGGSGALLRGALQTTVNGGNLNDPRLAGAGVTAGNFGPLAPGGNSGNLPVTFNATTAGPLSGQAVRILNNFDNVANQTLSITGTAYRYAAPGAHTPEPVTFGNFHVGHAPQPSRNLTISNTAAADGYSESLNASIGSPTGGVTTNGGSITGLVAGSSNSTALAVGISTATAGAKNGTATISLASNGTGSSGLGTTTLPSQTAQVTGAVYRYASPLLPGGTTVNFGTVHVGETAQRGVSVTNNAATDGFSESLNGAFSASSGDVTGSGVFTALAPGATSAAPVLALNTATAGTKSGTATLALVSNGTGSSGLGNTNLTPQVISVTGQVNHYAQPVFAKVSGPAAFSGGGTAYTVDFGRRTIGEAPPTVTLRLTNAAPAPADTLAGSFAAAAPDFTLTGFGPFSGIGAGQQIGDLVVAIQTDTLGAFSQTVTLNSVSENTGGYSGALTPVVITLQGSVAEAPTLKIARSGSNMILSWPVEEQGWILQRSDNLLDWHPVTEPVVDTPTEHTVTTPRGAHLRMFFRLEK
ncbi:MAG: choice-of-anchor D domain-containing protein, partial [Akkermansiaceae bacterium]|nr:choice-of-anchor D domain-containing protein [Akkermansiaceae bacterium]